MNSPVASCGAIVVFIPGGYTWRLQVMDVGINKPFKDRIRDGYDQFMCEHNYGSKAKREDVSQWVKLAFHGIRLSTIYRTWTKVGLETVGTGVVVDTIVHKLGYGVDFMGFQFEHIGINESTEEDEEAGNHYNDINDEIN
jgi:DDE superfamily endonuclease